MATTTRDGGRKTRASAEGAYVLVVRGPDGRPRSECFSEMKAYRSRLAALQASDGALSLDDIVGLLDGRDARPTRP